MDALRACPDYQQNDDLEWIAAMAGPAANQQRRDQMLHQPNKGGLFNGEPWTPPAKS